MDAPSPSITVAVVTICGATPLARCLDALIAQEQAPPFKVIVVYDPRLADIPQLCEGYPHVRLLTEENRQTPPALAASAIRAATGDVVLLTEDHCEPHPDWVRRLCAALTPERAAVGGVVETDAATPVNWAFYYADFYRYVKPLPAGPSSTLTVCNVAYRRACLEAISPVWATLFHETIVNDALRLRFGPLWLIPDAKVWMRRHVRLVGAVRERYTLGRLFGCTRFAFSGPGCRLAYRVFGPLLPLLLLGRMAVKVLLCRRILRPFLRGLPALIVLTLAWSWGEWLGYLTRRPPRALVIAPETPDCPEPRVASGR